MFSAIKELRLTFLSVNSVVKSITRMAVKLDELETRHKEKALHKTQKIKALEAQVTSELTEVQRAVTIRSNLRKLLGE